MISYFVSPNKHEALTDDKMYVIIQKNYGHVQRQSYFTTKSMGTNGPIGT